MQLIEVVKLSERVAANRSRSAKVAALATLLRQLVGDEIEIGIAMLSGQLPTGRVGFGPAALRTARQTPAAETPGLELRDVARTLQELAIVSGVGSTGRRATALAALFARAIPVEQDFLLHLLLGELRQGALSGLLTEALAQAAGLPIESIRRAAMLAGSLPPVGRAALTEGAAGLSSFHLQLFRPLQPMLAQPAQDAREALAQLGEAGLEFKVDGARIQVHREGEHVQVFSRLGNDVTVAVPEVVAAVRALPAQALVLDGEAVALHPNGAPQPFQVTMRRFGRRLDVDRLQAEIPLTPFFFDVLHLDGTDLIDRPASERFAALETSARGWTIPRRITASPEEAEQFLATALGRGHEGIMAKSIAAPYEAGRRGASWLKIKPAHTLDLVVLAAEWGHGRRHGWLSNLHLGARDPDNGGFVMLGKTFKGLTDEMLTWQTEKLRQITLATDEWTVYVKPELVVEIAFNDIQESPHYPGGLALRFARVKRYRLDKTAAEADTIAAVRARFAAARQHGS